MVPWFSGEYLSGEIAMLEISTSAPMPPGPALDEEVTIQSPAQFFAENQNIAGFDNVGSAALAPSRAPALPLTAPQLLTPGGESALHDHPGACGELARRWCPAASRSPVDRPDLPARRPARLSAGSQTFSSPCACASAPFSPHLRPCASTPRAFALPRSEALTIAQLDELRGLATRDRRDVDLYIAKVRFRAARALPRASSRARRAHGRRRRAHPLPVPPGVVASTSASRARYRPCPAACLRGRSLSRISACRRTTV